MLTDRPPADRSSTRTAPRTRVPERGHSELLSAAATLPPLMQLMES